MAPYFVWPHKTPIPMVELTPAEQEEYYDDSPKGILRVTLASASNLRNVDRIGTSDPYAVLTVGSLKKHSTVKDNNLNPVWNETFEFPVTDASSQYLMCNIKDEGVGINRSLGNVRIAISQVAGPVGRLPSVCFCFPFFV